MYMQMCTLGMNATSSECFTQETFLEGMRGCHLQINSENMNLGGNTLYFNLLLKQGGMLAA